MNPYEVLGVSENADEETIKKAYRELVKKYHPDKYVNNPLADLASEKLKQINEAYDMLTSGRTSSGAGSYSNNNYSHTANGSASFQTVRMYISQRRFNEAERMLAGLPKIAEWYYLSGVIQLNKGWYDTARQNILKAVQMNPNNSEYRQTLNSINNTGYRSYSSGMSNMSACECCSRLIAADCCCEMMGGDLIPCC